MSHRSWVQAPQGVLDLHPYKVLHCCWWTSHSLHYLFHFQATKIWCTLYVGCISWYLRNCCIAHGGHFGNAYKGAFVDCFHIARILDVCQFGPLLCCFSVSAIVGPGWVGWCSDMTSNHGVWGHTGVQFPLPGVVLISTSLLLCDNLCLLYEIGLLMSRQKFIIASLAKYASCAFSGLFFLCLAQKSARSHKLIS